MARIKRIDIGYKRNIIQVGGLELAQQAEAGEDITGGSKKPTLYAGPDGNPIWRGTDGVEAPIPTSASGGGASLLARAATTTALPNTPVYANGTAGVGATLTAGANAAFNDTGADGLTDFAVDDLLLVKNESTQSHNGLYRFVSIGGASSKWQIIRVAEFDSAAEMKAGKLIEIGEGTANAETSWFLTANVTTVGTTNVVFARETGVTLSADLASTSASKGASLVGVQDAASLLTATTVEAALAELAGQTGGQTIADPGNAGAIPVTRSGTCNMVTAGAETRTVAAPTFSGQELTLGLDTHGGDAVVTFAAAINATGNNTATFGAAGDFLKVLAITVASALTWRVVANTSTLSTV